ncbi:MAG: hypothetical protein ACLFM4_10595 [Phormidium sp.]|nr:MAG: hypothetical protein HLUCCO16_15085 [Phormidium sp. OSCR]
MMNFNQRSFPLAGVFALLLMLSACGDAPGEITTETSPDATPRESTANDSAESDYPPEVIAEFLDSCTGGDTAMQQFCECSIEEIQQQYSFEEFVEIDANLTANQDPPDAITAIFAACQS